MCRYCDHSRQTPNDDWHRLAVRSGALATPFSPTVPVVAVGPVSATQPTCLLQARNPARAHLVELALGHQRVLPYWQVAAISLLGSSNVVDFWGSLIGKYGVMEMLCRCLSGGTQENLGIASVPVEDRTEYFLI